MSRSPAPRATRAFARDGAGGGRQGAPAGRGAAGPHPSPLAPVVVIAGGGTGGHLFPGLAVAEELHRGGASVLWLGARRGLEAHRVPAAGIPLRLLPVTGAIGRSPLAQVGAGLRLAPAFVLALTHLLQHRAAAVLAVGGYAALPGALAGAALGVPVVIQEQNARPGVTNRLLAPWAVAIACGFHEAMTSFPSLPAVWSGNPVRSEFFAVPPPPPGPPGVLVLGGSQGSAFLNRTMPEALALAARTVPLPRVIHQAGERWSQQVRERYGEFGLSVDVVGFLERPADALAACGLAVARAGALTVCELAAARRAALLVPFAAAAHGHQLVNARALAETGAAEVVEERDATPEALGALVSRMLADPQALAARGERGAALARPGAARTVAELVLERAGISSAAPAPRTGGGAETADAASSSRPSHGWRVATHAAGGGA